MESSNISKQVPIIEACPLFDLDGTIEADVYLNIYCTLHYLDLQRMQNVCMMDLCSSQYLCSLDVPLLKLAKKTDCCGSF